VHVDSRDGWPRQALAVGVLVAGSGADAGVVLGGLRSSWRPRHGERRGSAPPSRPCASPGGSTGAHAAAEDDRVVPVLTGSDGEAVEVDGPHHRSPMRLARKATPRPLPRNSEVAGPCSKG
jgi:hypothetical protein